MDKFLIVDGSNLLFQMFFGMPSRIVNERGKAIHGTLGFIGALFKIIRMVEPTHMIVIFDGEHENDRRKLDSEYKANRIDFCNVCEEENPFSQLPDVYKALRFSGIKYYETTDCEADDLIASYTLSFGSGMDIVISSFDSDFFQLITEHVSVLRYRGKETVICTPDYIREKFDIAPMQYACFKSLVGDIADHIQGADKIGKKTAAKLLKEYHSLQEIIDNAERIGKPSIKESIIRNTEKLKINYQLIKLDRRAALPFGKEEMEYTYNGMTTMEVLKGIGLKSV